jgi:metal-responsive CopG/Arc/MetJ family transcriptional regulator
MLELDMLKTYLYIPQHLNEKINVIAKAQKKSKAEVIRQALERGLKEERGRSGAEALLDLVKFAKEQKIKGPRDLSTNHDYYLWGMPKKNPKIKP